MRVLFCRKFLFLVGCLSFFVCSGKADPGMMQREKSEPVRLILDTDM